MPWQPRYGRHISQLHPETNSGADDCGPACLTRYLFEAGKLAADLDPWAALAQVAAVVRGVPDSPYNNAVTDSNALVLGLAHYGITSASWTASYQACLNAPWSIILVRGPDLHPLPCPLSFWGDAPEGSGDHWMLWLPRFKGASNWFNNPLQTIPAQIDAQVDLGTLPAAFYGGVLLPSTGNGEDAPTRWTALRQFGLLPRAIHGSTALAVVPSGGTGMTWHEQRVVAGETWQRVQWRSLYGWTLAAYITG